MILNSHVHFPRLRSVHAFPKGETSHVVHQGVDTFPAIPLLVSISSDLKSVAKT